MTEIKLQVGSPHVLRDHIAEAIVGYGQGSNIRHTLEDLLAQVEEQVKPAVDEPEEFGSIVGAGIDGLSDRVLWVRSGSGYWFSETSRRAWFSDLHEPEVLRVGLGAKSVSDAYSRGYDDGAESNLPSPVDRSNINSALREAIAKISLREGRLIGEDHSFELATAVMKALAP